MRADGCAKNYLEHRRLCKAAYNASASAAPLSRLSSTGQEPSSRPCPHKSRSRREEKGKGHYIMDNNNDNDAMTAIIEQENTYTSGVYSKRPVAVVRGSGAIVWDADGREYIDCMAGHGVA